MRPAILKDKSRLYLRRMVESYQSKRWQWILALSFFVGVNGYIAYRVLQDWRELRALQWTVPDLWWLGATIAVQTAGLAVAVTAWSYMVGRFGYRVSFWDHFTVYVVSMLAQKLPGVGWNILSRMHMYGNRDVDRLQVSVLAIVELPLIGVASVIVTLMTLAVPGTPFNYVHPGVLVGILAAVIVVLPSPLFRPLLNWLNRRRSGALCLKWYHVLQFVALSVVTVVLGGVTLFTFVRSFHPVAPAALVTLIQLWAVLLVAGSLLFWLPVDLQIANGLTVIGLSSLMPLPQAVVLLIAWRAWDYIIRLIWMAIAWIPRLLGVSTWSARS